MRLAESYTDRKTRQDANISRFCFRLSGKALFIANIKADHGGYVDSYPASLLLHP